MRKTIGLLPGYPADEILAFVDPIKQSGQRPPGESEHGIALYNPPSCLLRDDPQLWHVVDELQSGYRATPTPGEYSELSSWHIDCLSIWRPARARAEKRYAETIQKNKGES